MKDITIADLNEDDLKCLKCGTYQILPQRDHADRPVMCVVTIGRSPLFELLAMVSYTILNSVHERCLRCLACFSLTICLPSRPLDTKSIVRRGINQWCF